MGCGCVLNKVHPWILISALMDIKLHIKRLERLEEFMVIARKIVNMKLRELPSTVVPSLKNA